MNIAAIDMGNSLFKAIINGRDYLLPNALARCTLDSIDYYDSSQQDFIGNLIVEASSNAITHNNEKFFVGFSATEKENISNVSKNNQKASSERSIILLLTMLAYDSVQVNPGETDIKVDFDVVATALPTRQVRRDREELKVKLLGEHVLKFRYVPGTNDITVTISIKEVIVGIEGAAAYVALTHNPDTLGVNNVKLARETILIADIGGDTTDFAGIRGRKIVDGIEGEIFGINTYLDRIIQDVETYTGYRFPSRYSLEKRLVNSPDMWKIVTQQEEVDIRPFIEPHLIEMSDKFLDLLDQKRKHVSIQEARHYFCIGGSVKVAKVYIESENGKRKQPMKLTLPDNLETLNVSGLWILAQAKAMKTLQQAVASTKQD